MAATQYGPLYPWTVQVVGNKYQAFNCITGEAGICRSTYDSAYTDAMVCKHMPSFSTVSDYIDELALGVECALPTM
jgi:hypothetical protein